MKKTLIILGYFILFIISFGTLFKLQHWPGSGALLVLGISGFAIIFLPLFFIQRMLENGKPLNIITNIFGLLSTSTIFMGVLFRVQHWPGGSMMVVTGTFVFAFPTLILYTVQQFKEYDRKFSEFWRTITMGVLVSVFLMFWGLTTSKNILFSYLKVEDATIETNKNLLEFNNFLLIQIDQKHTDNSQYHEAITTIHESTTKMMNSIEEIKNELLQYTVPEGTTNHWNSNALDNYDIPTNYLGTSQSEKGIDLWQSLNRHKMILSEQLNKISFENPDIIKSMGDFGIKTDLKPEMKGENESRNEVSWNEGMFNLQPMAGALALLSGIQNEVLSAEFKTLTTILTNAK